MTHPLDPYTGDLVTSVGAAWPGTRAVFNGRDLHAEVMHDTGWFQLLSEGVGRRLNDAQAAFMDKIFVQTSYPDARIWNNRVASLVGSTRGTSALALSAANAVSESTAYGRRNEAKAVAFFQETRRRMEEGASLEQVLRDHIVEHRIVPGYGRPLHNGDERIAPMMLLGRQYGVDGGPCVALAFEVQDCLAAMGKNLKMNAGALVSAYGADFGFTPHQWTTFMYQTFAAGMVPCYMEALSKPVGAMFASRCEDVRYTGPEAREWLGDRA